MDFLISFLSIVKLVALVPLFYATYQILSFLLTTVSGWRDGLGRKPYSRRLVVVLSVLCLFGLYL